MYHQFAKWTSEKVWFVTRMKANADYHVTKVLADKTKRKNVASVLKEPYITVPVKQNGVVTGRLKLRCISFKTKEGKLYLFITNNFTLPASQIATIYKNRWMIELLFKQIKQNFPLRYFWGNSTNAIKMQVYCVLIAQLLMVVIGKKAATMSIPANFCIMKITLLQMYVMNAVIIT